MNLQASAPFQLGVEVRVARALGAFSDFMEQLGPGSWISEGGRSGVAFAARIDCEWLCLRAECIPAVSWDDDARWSLLGMNGVCCGGAKIALDTTVTRLFLCADIPLDDDSDPTRRVVQACVGLEQAAAMLRGAELHSGGHGTLAHPSGGAPLRPLPAGRDLASLCSAAQWPGIERESGVVAVDLGVRDPVCRALLQVRSDGRIAASVDLEGDPVGDDGPPPVCRQALAMLLLRMNGSVRMARATVAGGAPRIEVVFDDAPAPVELRHALAALSVACRITAREAEILARHEDVARRYLEWTRGASNREGEPTGLDAAVGLLGPDSGDEHTTMNSHEQKEEESWKQQ
jgi:hypothetical protein